MHAVRRRMRAWATGQSQKVWRELDLGQVEEQQENLQDHGEMLAPGVARRESLQKGSFRDQGQGSLARERREERKVAAAS